MKWSKYCVPFSSSVFGKMAFNTATGALIKITPELEKTAGEMRGEALTENFAGDPMAYFRLRRMGFIVPEGADGKIYEAKRKYNMALWQSTETLSLTVAVTDGCNFRCPYCFEKEHRGNVMTAEIQDKLIEFIKRNGAKRLNIVWYGGEPLMAFDVIRALDRRIKALDIPYCASLVTNGYLLMPPVANKLNGLNISTVQITLDGDEKTHNLRRPLAGGGETYKTVTENIRTLAESDYSGRIMIRVNVDGGNKDEFAAVYDGLRRDYPEKFGKTVIVYPGFVKGEGKQCFTGEHRGQFAADMYENHGILTASLCPKWRMQSCTMTNRNAFVVGASGEIYKCWDYVGDNTKIIGSLDACGEVMTDNSYLEDEKCRDCALFPVCDGGCPNARGNGEDTCTYFKNNLPMLLELYCRHRSKEKS